ncbi:pantoate--beta-alanine ligase [Clostridium niameyense]|uniref:pantoate--beta-alanine ligase n=1 Tax=Clostridium niameyense TaxID=1622073 RepID=UPI00067ECDF6|nr:pantoate--beta-alanine ligase [Clostridium niameyense]
MKVMHTIKEVKNIINKWKKDDLSIGYVPTMGYLHEGHASLIKKAREENDKVIVSIFVNPIQFGPNEDYASYPRDLNKDSALCDSIGADLVFNPEPSEMYPNKTYTHVNVSLLTNNLCGARRPGHFQGVCTVLTKFFNIITPNKAYFGEKDAQQLAVIKKMVKDLNFNVEIVGCPIVREIDGLAKSSRNSYLNKEERTAALVLNKSLKTALNLLKSEERNPSKIKNLIIETIEKEPLAKIDYVEIVDSLNLQSVENIDSNILIAIAVYVGNTRLIDNFTFEI